MNCSAYQENVVFVKVYVVGSWAKEPSKIRVMLPFQPYLGRIWRKQENVTICKLMPQLPVFV